MRPWLALFALFALFGGGCSLDRTPLDPQLRHFGSHAGTSGFSQAGTDASGGSAGVSATAGAGGGGSGVAGTGSTDGCGGSDDGDYCNGSEHCAPHDPSADARGCVRTPRNCAAMQVCDEGAKACVRDCTLYGDADGDGYDALECGGSDCDDLSPLVRAPGAVDVCNGIDDDCNGAVDDGFASFGCFRANTIAQCVSGACTVLFCSSGYADCDLLADNGCERLVDTVVGDCRVEDCAGNSLIANEDRPVDDGNPCTVEACVNGVPTVTPRQNGSACKDGTCQGGVCVADD